MHVSDWAGWVPTLLQSSFRRKIRIENQEGGAHTAGMRQASLTKFIVTSTGKSWAPETIRWQDICASVSSNSILAQLSSRRASQHEEFRHSFNELKSYLLQVRRASCMLYAGESRWVRSDTQRARDQLTSSGFGLSFSPASWFGNWAIL